MSEPPLPIGEPGPAGGQGDPGPSVYDIWLESNPGGTLAEFFESLKGGPGDQGDRGLDSTEPGDQGDTGPSLYDLWLEDNPGGTRADFFEAMRGPAGKAGPRAVAEIVTVDSDVRRVYRTTTVPLDGAQPADLVVSLAPEPAGPVLLLPDLYSWIDASQTLDGDLAALLPDVSGQGNHFNLTSGRTSAVMTSYNGWPAFNWRTNTRYQSASGGAATVAGQYLLVAGTVRLNASGDDLQIVWTDNTLPNTKLERNRTAGTLNLYLEGTLIATAPIDTTAAVVFVARLNGTASALWVNGVRAATVTTVAQPDSIHGRLIGQVGSIQTMSGLLMEYIEAKGVNAPSTAVCTELSEYMRQKWRI